MALYNFQFSLARSGSVEWVGRVIGKLLSGDFAGALAELGSIFGRRGQFGLDVMRAGMYFLEPGERVLSRSEVMRLVSMLAGRSGEINVTIPVTISGPVYGVADLDERIRRVIETSVGNILYDIARRGVR